MAAETTTAPTLASFLVEMVESTALELSSSLASSSMEVDEQVGEPACTHISEAIKAQGIDDLTRLVGLKIFWSFLGFRNLFNRVFQIKFIDILIIFPGLDFFLAFFITNLIIPQNFSFL